MQKLPQCIIAATRNPIALLVLNALATPVAGGSHRHRQFPKGTSFTPNAPASLTGSISYQKSSERGRATNCASVAVTIATYADNSPQGDASSEVWRVEEVTTSSRKPFSVNSAQRVVTIYASHRVWKASDLQKTWAEKVAQVLAALCTQDISLYAVKRPRITSGGYYGRRRRENTAPRDDGLGVLCGQ